MSFLKCVTFFVVVSLLIAVISVVYLYFAKERTVKVFSKVYKIKKVVDKFDNTLYYTLYTFRQKFIWFNIYMPVALTDIDDYFGNSHSIKIKFNSVEDAEGYYERNFNKIETK